MTGRAWVTLLLAVAWYSQAAASSGTAPEPRGPPSTVGVVGTAVRKAPAYVKHVTGGGTKPAVVRAVSVKRFGAVGDGVTDDTKAFQEAADAARDKGMPLVIPATRSFYKLTHRIAVHGSVVGVDRPRIRMVGATGDSDFMVLQVKYRGPGMWITGLHLEGGFDPSGRGSPGGDYRNQYSHGIGLFSARNVTIEDNIIENVMGDSIYLGVESPAAGPCRNIRINGNTLRNPFRNNISFISTDGVTVTNNVTIKLNTFVINYDFEPNQDPEGNFNVEIAYNQDSIPERITDPGMPFQYEHVCDVSARTSRPGGNLFLHDNSVYPGGSFGKGWWRGNRGNLGKYGYILVENNR